METRYPAHPEDFRRHDTDRIRREYLIERLFEPGRANLVYVHMDRMIVGAVCPDSAVLALEAGKRLASAYFLERRELGLINIGGKGAVIVDGWTYDLDTLEGMYVGMGSREVSFASADSRSPAKFYLNSAPAHTAHLTRKISQRDAQQVRIGSAEDSNLRTIYQYIHPAVLKSCQLVMGMTALDPGSVWNTMSCHTHERRMEVYMYFGLAAHAVVFHFLGQPTETRHIVVRNEEAVLSPSWSIHSGVGTTHYNFIWGMAGENQIFTDMDQVPMDVLR